MEINGHILNAELEDILEELRRQMSLNGYQYLQKEPKQSGNSLQIQCPYHSNGQERNRSAGIRMKDGILHCFACNQVHTLPEVISYCFGHEDDERGKWGWRWLVKNFAVIEVEERKDVSLDFDRNTRSIDECTSFIQEVELKKYRYIHPYMYKRRLTDDIIELFDIGYDKNTKCITFPVRDINGNCLFIARRSVKYKFFQYPEGVEKPLYGLYELSQLQKYPDEIIICESMLDALTCWVYGKYAVALNGLGNDLSITQIRKLPCRKVILATDKDDAGKKARIRLRKELNNKIVTELDYRTYPDHAKDINDMTREEFYTLGEVF